MRLGWDNTKSWWTPKVVDMHIKLFDADYSDIYADSAGNSDGERRVPHPRCSRRKQPREPSHLSRADRGRDKPSVQLPPL